MVFQPKLHKKTIRRLTVSVVVFCCCLIFSASNLLAADHWVYGQVFRVTSAELAEKQAKADIEGVTLDLNTLETQGLPFVRIKIYNKATGELLAEGDTNVNGGYYIKVPLTTPPPTEGFDLRVFLSSDGGHQLQPEVREGENTLAPVMTYNQKKLLVINDDLIDYLDASSPTDLGVGLVFTRVGKVPIEHIDQSPGAKQGLADVPDSAPGYVPRFVDAPFGGSLLIFGDFGPPRTTSPCAGSQVDWYSIKITRIDVSPNKIYDYKDTLAKVRTIVSTGTPLTVTNDTEVLGPYTGKASTGSIQWLYKVNRNSALIYYSYPDLRMSWNSSGLSGVYEFKVTYYKDLGTGTPTAPDVEVMSEGPLDEKCLKEPPETPCPCFKPAEDGIGKLILRINNQPLDVSFDGIYIKEKADDADGDDYNKEKLCSIMDLKDSSNDYGIQIKYTAHHTGSYMLSYSLSAIANDTMAAGGGPDVEFITPYPTQYDPDSSTAPLWIGTPSTGTSAFRDHSFWNKTCAFIIDLAGTSRVQNGYKYIQSRHKRRAYYIIPN